MYSAKKQKMTESIISSRPLTEEVLDDPRASIGDLVVTAGFEALTPEERLGVIENSTVADYKAAIDAVHRKVAPDESHEVNQKATKIADPNTGELRYMTAEPDARDGILEKAHGLAQEVIAVYRREGGDIENVLRRCGNLAAFGALLAHQYEEGNGRTARTIAELIEAGFDRNDQDTVDSLRVVSTNRPATGSRIYSFVPSGEWASRANTEPEAFLNMVAALDVPLDQDQYNAATVGSFAYPRIATTS
jgi:hypothetical protein